MTQNIQSKIKELVTSNKVVLFMKGTPEFPQCGFSAKAVQCLQSVGAVVTAVDVLSDPDIRQGIKDFTNWPTIPQVFINGEFVGGCDIIAELFESGELEKMVAEPPQAA